MDSDVRELPTKDGMFLRDAIGGTIKDTDENLRQVLVSFPHDTEDTYKTTFDRDAFRESFEKRKPLVCWQHDLRDPLGRAIDAQVLRSTNELVGQLDDFNMVPNAGRAYSQIQSGTITDFSFGFRHPQYEKHRSLSGVRNIRRATMLEFSPVSIGSIPGAVATGLREEEIEMAEQSLSAQEIIAAVNADLLSKEDGQRMLASLDGFREHITIKTPEQVLIEQLEAENKQLREAGTGTTVEPVEPDGDDDLEWVPPELPDTVRAEDLLRALHPTWQRALEGIRIAIAPAGEEPLLRAPDSPGSLGSGGDSAKEIASAIDAACDSAADWLRDVDVETLPDPVQQAIALYQAGGVSAGALLDVMGVNDPDKSMAAGQRSPTSPSSEPGSPAGAENMAPTKVVCDMCSGTGETEDGKTCPQCGGSGVEAVTRDDLPEDAPDDAATCPTCKGKGKLPAPKGGGHQLKCRNCKGKGWITKDDADDMDKRAVPSAWSEKPWSDFKQSDYTPQQWKSACLVVQGDGSTKGQCVLPVKEPDGTYNVHGIAAAAARLNQTSSASSEEKADAAGQLADLYSKMGKDVPPNVAKYTSRDANLSPEELEEQRQAALEKLEKRTEKRTPAAV